MQCNNLKLLFQCLSNVAASGYGGVYQNFMFCLLRRGVNVLRDENAGKPDIQLYLGQPDRRWQNSWKRLADAYGLFTMFESEVLPANWVEDVNRDFDFLIVPSRWCRDIFSRGGIEIPIYLVPLGINPAVFPKLTRPERETLTIIWQGFHQDDRKGFALLDRAFDELKLPDSRLIKKISPFSTESMVHFEFRTDRWSICKNLTRAEMLLLLREADVSVNPTAGEGFGLIPLEHMATGLPVLVSENSGCLDYRNPACNIGIRCEEGLSWFGPGYGTMMVPVYEDLRDKLRWVYENREEAARIGERAAEWIHKEWTYEKATDKLLEVIHEHHTRRK